MCGPQLAVTLARADSLEKSCWTLLKAASEGFRIVSSCCTLRSAWVRCPSAVESSFKQSDDHELKTREAEAIASFLLVPGLKTFANMMMAMPGITPAKALGFACVGAAAAEVLAQMLLSRRV
jgi:hypothetical protein